MHRSTRRRFLAVTCGMAGVAGLGLYQRFPTSPAGPVAQLVRRTHGARAFGTAVRITALHQDARVADAAATAALAELEVVEQVMSLYRADSQLTRLNRDGRLDDPHPYLRAVLAAADDIWRRSQGAFDACVQPLWDLYYPARGERRSPSAAEIAEARSRVDWSAVQIDPAGAIEFARPGIALTLNGIAQGFATDRAIAALERHGVTRAMLDTGEIGALGRREQDEPWKVGIQHPREPDQYLSLARLAGRCLATSGDYATPLSDDRRLHHVFDPRTGASPQELASVTIVAHSALEADALSTAVLVLGVEQGRELVARSPGAAAMLCTKAGRVVATPDFPLADEREAL